MAAGGGEGGGEQLELLVVDEHEAGFGALVRLPGQMRGGTCQGLDRARNGGWDRHRPPGIPLSAPDSLVNAVRNASCEGAGAGLVDGGISVVVPDYCKPFSPGNTAS